jgi:hypothetical protein
MKANYIGRNYTHDFYTDAIEMSYLSRRADLAFYLWKKAGAVLLNDKLNELNASSHLSSIDASNQEHYEIKIVGVGTKIIRSSGYIKATRPFAITIIKYQKIHLNHL